MHELALVESLIDSVEASAEGARVRKVEIQVGALLAVVPDTLRMFFSLCTERTRMEGAELSIEEVDALARCRRCDIRETFFYGREPCPCGADEWEIVKGEELRLIAIEVC